MKSIKISNPYAQRLTDKILKKSIEKKDLMIEDLNDRIQTLYYNSLPVVVKDLYNSNYKGYLDLTNQISAIVEGVDQFRIKLSKDLPGRWGTVIRVDDKNLIDLANQITILETQIRSDREKLINLIYAHKTTAVLFKAMPELLQYVEEVPVQETLPQINEEMMKNLINKYANV